MAERMLIQISACAQWVAGKILKSIERLVDADETMPGRLRWN